MTVAGDAGALPGAAGSAARAAVAPRGRRRRTGADPRRERPLRAAVAVLLAGTAVGLVVFNHVVRSWEAQLFAPLVGLAVPGGGTGTSGAILYVGLGRTSAFGLRITDECTTAVLVVPLLIVIGGFALATSIALRRVAMALGVALGSLLLVNAIRIAVVAFSTHHFGEEGFRVAHVLIGSAFALCGFALSLFLTVRVLVKDRRTTA